MKDKEKIFNLLRKSVETPQESIAVEEMIKKFEGNLPQVEIIDDKHQKFNGITYGTSNSPRMTGLYFKLLSLHRMVWICYNGEIPEGHDIHHKDFDKENNVISNLELVHKDEHKKIHLAHKTKKVPEKKQKFICKVCGKEYESVNRSNNTYCSVKCKKTAERVRATKIKICKVCGKEFSTRDDAEICSKKCLGKFLNRQEIKTCPVCGKTFSDVVSKHRKHCSPECAAAALRKREIRTGIHCGKEFSTLTSRTQKFCSRECFYKHRKI